MFNGLALGRGEGMYAAVGRGQLLSGLSGKNKAAYDFLACLLDYFCALAIFSLQQFTS
uniref:Uncharacterized protein n=1 Tax=Anguilla anguilla TaxID=7936 RepID=A0A0E9SJK1_ANGAN